MHPRNAWSSMKMEKWEWGGAIARCLCLAATAGGFTTPRFEWISLITGGLTWTLGSSLQINYWLQSM